MTVDKFVSHLITALDETPNYWELKGIAEVVEFGEECFSVLSYSETDDQYLVLIIHKGEGKLLDSYFLDRHMERI